MRKVFLLVLNLVLLALVLVTLGSFLGAYNFVFEFLSHSRPLLFLSAIVLTLLMLAMRSRRAVYCGIALCLINAVQIVSLYIPYKVEGNASDPRIKLLQMNIWGGKNLKFKAVIKEIEQEDPDIVGISELTKGWWQILQPKVKKYPYQVVEASFGGICLLSKFPIKDGRVEHFGEIKRPRIVAHVLVKDKWVKMIFAHPIIPMRRIGVRDAELAAIALDASSSQEPVIVAGDLNCTPFSYFFYKLQRDGKLLDSEKGFGYQPSWSTFHLLPLFCIDHCLFSSEFSTVKRYNGPNVGSDHLPVITELSLNTRK
jgi:endonuclease/exonuclease/phosphatase (EEP) superfamily protein YafD